MFILHHTVVTSFLVLLNIFHLNFFMRWNTSPACKRLSHLTHLYFWLLTDSWMSFMHHLSDTSYWHFQFFKIPSIEFPSRRRRRRKLNSVLLGRRYQSANPGTYHAHETMMVLWLSIMALWEELGFTMRKLRGLALTSPMLGSWRRILQANINSSRQMYKALAWLTARNSFGAWNWILLLENYRTCFISNICQ